PEHAERPTEFSTTTGPSSSAWPRGTVSVAHETAPGRSAQGGSGQRVHRTAGDQLEDAAGVGVGRVLDPVGARSGRRGHAPASASGRRRRPRRTGSWRGRRSGCGGGGGPEPGPRGRPG